MSHPLNQNVLYQMIQRATFPTIAEKRAALEMAALIAPQPAVPAVSATTTALIDMLRQRDAAGLKKYGTTLDRTDLSLADWLQHMTEEMLDSAGYAQAALRVLNHFHTELSRALATAKWIDDGSESPNASSARVVISILTGLLETIKQPAPKADSENITEADLERMAPLPATSAEADKSCWRIDPEPYQHDSGMWTCGIDIGDHGAAIECHGDTREEALLRAQTVMRAAAVPQPAPFASGKINGYLPRQRAVEIKLDSDVPAWMTAATEVRVTIYPASAAPQASPEPITLGEKLRSCEAALSAAERVIADLLAGKLPEGYVLAPHRATDVIKDAMQPLMPSGSRDIAEAAYNYAVHAGAFAAAPQPAAGDRYAVGKYGEWGSGGAYYPDQAPGYPVLDRGRAIAWFVMVDDAKDWVASKAAPQPAGEVGPRHDLVPGVMRCAKCAFQLHRVTLYVRSGTTGAGDSDTEPCPNGCGPLWPVTWRQWAEEAQEYAQRLQGELDALKAEPATSAPLLEDWLEAIERMLWLADNGERPNRGEVHDVECAIAGIKAMIKDSRSDVTSASLGDALSLDGAAGRSASRAPAGAEALAKPMTLEVAFDFADNPRPYHSLACPADTNGELYRALKVLAAEARRLSGAQQTASIAGEAVEIGDDEGQPRLLIHTTREAIAACRASLLFKPVVVVAAKDGA